MRFMDSSTTRPTGKVLHRPGFADGAMTDAKKAAYDSYEKTLTSAWENPTGHGPIGSQIGDICTCRGPEFPDDIGSPGHLKMISGKLVCTPDQPRSGRSTPARPLPRTDAQDVRDVEAQHRENMNILHDQLDRSLADAWRNVR
jgi:hypothetical protein